MEDDRLITLGTQIMQDAYKKDRAIFEDYLCEYMHEDLTNYKLFKMLDKYGRFTFHFDDNIWTDFKLNYAGRKFVEKGSKLEYDVEAKTGDWIALFFLIIILGFVGNVIGLLFYYLTEFVSEIEKTLILKYFQIITAAIVIGFCFLYQRIDDKKKWKNSRFFLLCSLIALLFMIIYECICLEEEAVGTFTLYIQYGFVGAILFSLYNKRK